MTHSHRSWFPYILIGLTIGLGAMFYALEQKEEASEAPRASNDDGTASVVVPASEEGYQSAVTALVSAYSTEKDAQATYNALILLRVPTELQQLHLDLVIAFSQLAAGNREDGEARLTLLKAQYSWLPL